MISNAKVFNNYEQSVAVGQRYDDIEALVSEDPMKVVGMKFDGHKTRFDLIPPHAEKEVARVLTFGARKYSADNWKLVDDAERRYLSAAMRHIHAARSGERHDPESGFHHLAHAVCCLMFIMELQHELG